MTNTTPTPKQQRVLEQIKAGGPQSRVQLEAALNMTQPEMRACLRKLNALRLIQVSPPRNRFGTWHTPEDAGRAREIKEAGSRAARARSRAACARRQQERKAAAAANGGMDAERLQAEAEVRQFCESPVVWRIIPAANAPRIEVRGPASVWQLALFAGRG